MEIKFIDWTLFSLVHNDKKTDKWFWITQQWYLLMYVLHNKTFEKNCFWLFIHSRKIAQLVKNGKIVQWIMYYRYVELFATKSDNPHFWRWYLYYYLGPLTVLVVASPLKKRTLILECRKFNCHLFRIFAHSAKIGFLYFHFSRYVKHRICLTAFTPTCQSKNKYNFPIYLLHWSQLPTNLSWFYLKCQFNHTLAWADRGGNFRG